MILNRLGDKSAIALKVQAHFPPHDAYFEPFFGAGGMFFNKPKAKFNFLNDADKDVYNLFRVAIDQTEELIRLVEIAPAHEAQFKEWGKGRQEATPVLQALRFLWLSNFGLYGKQNNMRMGLVDPRGQILANIDGTLRYMANAYFTCADFRDFFRRLDYRGGQDNDRCFVYCDPPYLGTDNNYASGFTEQDSRDLFDVLEASGLRWAMSEFDHPFILGEAAARGLNV